MPDNININSGISGDGLRIKNSGQLAVGVGATAKSTRVERLAKRQHGEPDAAGPPDTGVEGAERYMSVIALDIERFNASERDDPIRLELRFALLGMVRSALSAEGVDQKDTPVVDSTGDGWMIVVHEDVSRSRLLHSIKRHLSPALREYNRTKTRQAQLRVRVVIHAGEMLLTGNRATGEQLNFAFRLLDSDELRRFLKDNNPAPMVLCVSDHIYQHVIRQRHDAWDPEAFSAIEVAVKETRARGWVCVPPAW